MKNKLGSQRNKQRLTVLLKERRDLQELVESGALAEDEADAIVLGKAKDGDDREKINTKNKDKDRDEEEEEEVDEEALKEERELARKAKAKADAAVAEAGKFDPYTGPGAVVERAESGSLVPHKIR